MDKKNILLILTILIFVIGVGISYTSYRDNKLAIDMQNRDIWSFKKFGAKIIVSDIEKKAEGTARDFYRGTNRNNTNELVSYNTRYYYRPLIAYNYFVNGKKYTGRMISYDTDTFVHDKLSVLITLDKYKKGKLVDLYYNIKNPNKSYLEAGEEQCTVIPTIITSMAFIISSCLFYKSY